ncbi:hypothetical protein EJ06DRAFT_558476 [Trichodelitschia bisporula]|uniref:Uncharacterized protein n=1 Tax=Trichodelitschia bisporula TaxID=703511 RepID=A0A6G1HQ04_9PEZI|nr:hypothetical protein EJ06DRAFT_558476 [Trichodelitschia bisporula]
MKSLLFALLPLLAAALPDAYPAPAPEPEPQIPQLIGLASGAIILGALGSAYENSRPCNTCNNAKVQCSGNACECENQASIACWVSKRGGCSLKLKGCPAVNGGGATIVSQNSDYPPCGQGLPTCGSGRACRKVDPSCTDWTGRGTCVGLCIPSFTGAQQPAAAPAQTTQPWWQQWSQPKASQPAQAAPKIAECPRSYQCPQGTLCVQDPRDTLAPIRGGPAFLCVDGNNVCGGFRNDQCQSGRLCVPDPRNKCSGPGCTGVCA